MTRANKRLNDVLGAYLEAHDAGWAPAQAALLTRYPEFKSELEAFFVAQSRVAALAYPCPASAQRQGRDADAAPSADRFERNPASGYETLEWIGGGGMGDVYKAWQKGAERWVALKKIKPGRFTPREVRRFLVEAQAAANLDHPNIVPIFDVGEENGQPFYSMKLVEHGTLQEHLARFQQSHRAAARLLAKVARAMHHAHQFGIVHRDLKPANILLDAQEHPYVADFGLAKRLGPASAGAPPVPAAGAAKAPTARERKTEAAGRDDDDAAQTGPTQALGDGAGQTLDRTATADAPHKTATRRGTFVGTIGYAAPENADVSGDATSTVADVYSLGAVLYKLLTGVTLFEANSVAEYARQVKRGRAAARAQYAGGREARSDLPEVPGEEPGEPLSLGGGAGGGSGALAARRGARGLAVAAAHPRVARGPPLSLCHGTGDTARLRRGCDFFRILLFRSRPGAARAGTGSAPMAGDLAGRDWRAALVALERRRRHRPCVAER